MTKSPLPEVDTSRIPMPPCKEPAKYTIPEICDQLIDKITGFGVSIAGTTKLSPETTSLYVEIVETLMEVKRRTNESN